MLNFLTKFKPISHALVVVVVAVATFAYEHPQVVQVLPHAAIVSGAASIILAIYHDSSNAVKS